MAYFEGTKEGFYKFLGPRTSDIVFKLSKPQRKEQKSCKRLKDDNEKCKKRTSLHAAHLKGREREILINEILEEFGTTGSIKDTYRIELSVFEEKFIEKHSDFFNVIEFMCAKHHKAYDLANKTVHFIEGDVEMIDEELIVTITETDYTKDAKTIKAKLIEELDFLNKNNCSSASISKEIWNFNLVISELKEDYYLLFYNQLNRTVEIGKIEANTLNKQVPPKNSDKKRISISIPFSNSEFIEKKTGYIFEMIEVYNLAQ